MFDQFRRLLALLVASAALSGCFGNSADEVSGTDAKGQPWTITLVAQPDTFRLPETQAIKLLGGDLAAYIKEECEPLWASERCDVYAQADPDGALVGYLTLIKTDENNVIYETDTLTNQKQACLLGGKLESIEGDINSDFSARAPFHYVGEGRDAGGMIYLKRRGDNLRVTDERWNYCYGDRHIDDVYVLVGSFVRSAPRVANVAEGIVWECDFGDPRGPFNVTLTANSYEFGPYNPDDGALRGEVREAGQDGWNGTIMTELEFVGGGAPVGRWGWVEEPGKRKALFMYAVESSGDGSECTPPGKGPQYMVQ